MVAEERRPSRIQDVIARSRAYLSSADGELIQRAYDYTLRLHAHRGRQCSAAYPLHPLEVAVIVADLRLDAASVCASLLHDVVENNLATIEELSEEFGVEVAELVDGVTKLSKINFVFKHDREAEDVRKGVVAIAQDLRALLIKFCDRLDNMRTIEHLPREAQQRMARETLEIYAPLANRLGIQAFKSDLEDLSFKCLEPQAYAELVAQLDHTKKRRDMYIGEVRRMLASRLVEQGFAADVYGRAKHLYSIFQKMRSRGSDLERIWDRIAFRVVVASVEDCYAALAVIHSQWTPIPGRFKDYVALPKPWLYQSLHTTLIGPGRERFEIQIRTHEMHYLAELGHWRYKEGKTESNTSDAAFRALRDAFASLKDPIKFCEEVKVTPFQDEAYVLTPKGELLVFPRGATPIDFAYRIHTQLGDHVTGAIVNSKKESLAYKLRNGDVIEILTGLDQRPKEEWLDLASTTRARSKIRRYIRRATK